MRSGVPWLGCHATRQTVGVSPTIRERIPM